MVSFHVPSSYSMMPIEPSFNAFPTEFTYPPDLPSPPHVARKAVPFWESAQQTRFEEICKKPIKIEGKGALVATLDVSMPELLQFIGMALTYPFAAQLYGCEWGQIKEIYQLFNANRTKAYPLDAVLAGGAATYTVIGQDFPYKDLDLVIYVPTSINREQYECLYKNIVANYVRMKLWESFAQDPKKQCLCNSAATIRADYFSDLMHFPGDWGAMCGLNGPQGLNISFIYKPLHYSVGVTTGWIIGMSTGLISCTDGLSFCQDEQQIMEAYHITRRRLNPVPHPQTVHKLGLRLLHRSTLGFQNEEKTIALAVEQLEKTSHQTLTSLFIKHQSSHYPFAKLAWVAEFITALSYAPENTAYCAKLAKAWSVPASRVDDNLAAEVYALSIKPHLTTALLTRVKWAAFLALGRSKEAGFSSLQAYRFFFMDKEDALRSQFALIHPAGKHYMSLPQSDPLTIAKEYFDAEDSKHTKELFEHFGSFLRALGLKDLTIEERSKSQMTHLFFEAFCNVDKLFSEVYRKHFYDYLRAQNHPLENSSLALNWLSYVSPSSSATEGDLKAEAPSKERRDMLVEIFVEASKDAQFLTPSQNFETYIIALYAFAFLAYASTSEIHLSTAYVYLDRLLPYPLEQGLMDAPLIILLKATAQKINPVLDAKVLDCLLTCQKKQPQLLEAIWKDCGVCLAELLQRVVANYAADPKKACDSLQLLADSFSFPEVCELLSLRKSIAALVKAQVNLGYSESFFRTALELYSMCQRGYKPERAELPDIVKLCTKLVVLADSPSIHCGKSIEYLKARGLVLLYNLPDIVPQFTEEIQSLATKHLLIEIALIATSEQAGSKHSAIPSLLYTLTCVRSLKYAKGEVDPYLKFMQTWANSFQDIHRHQPAFNLLLLAQRIAPSLLKTSIFRNVVIQSEKLCPYLYVDCKNDSLKQLMTVCNLWTMLSTIKEPEQRATCFKSIVRDLIESFKSTLIKDNSDDGSKSTLKIKKTSSAATSSDFLKLGEDVLVQPQLVEALIELVQTALFLQHHATSKVMPAQLVFQTGSESYQLLGCNLSLEQLAMRTWQSWRMLEPHAPFVRHIFSILPITRFSYDHAGKKALAYLWMERFQRASFRFQNFEKFFGSWQKEAPWNKHELEKCYAKMTLKVLIDELPQKSVLRMKLQVIFCMLRRLIYSVKNSSSSISQYIHHIQANFKLATQLIDKENHLGYKDKLNRALLCMLPQVIYDCSGVVFFELFQFFQILINQSSQPALFKFQSTVAMHFLKASERTNMLLTLEMLCELYKAWKIVAKKLTLKDKTLERVQEILLRRILGEIKLNNKPLEDCNGGLLYFKYLESMVNTPHFGALEREIMEIFSRVFENSHLENFLKSASEKTLKNAANLAFRLMHGNASKSVSANMQKLAEVLITHSQLSLAGSLALLIHPETQNIAELLLKCIVHTLASSTWLNSRTLLQALVHKFSSIESAQKRAPQMAKSLNNIMKEDFSKSAHTMCDLVEFLSHYSLELAEEALELFKEVLGEYFDMSCHSLICRQIETGIPSSIETAFKKWLDLKPSTHNLHYLISANKFLSHFLSGNSEHERISHVVTGIFHMLEIQQKEIIGWPALRKKHSFEKLFQSLSYLDEARYLPFVTQVWEYMQKCLLLNAESPIPLLLLCDKVSKKEIPPGTWRVVKDLIESKRWNKDIARLYFELTVHSLHEPSALSDTFLESILIPTMCSHSDEISLPRKDRLLTELLAAKKYKEFSAVWLNAPQLCQADAQVCVKMLEGASKSRDGSLMEMITTTVIQSELLVSKKFDDIQRFEAFNHLCTYIFQTIVSKCATEMASKKLAENSDPYTPLIKTISHQIFQIMPSKKSDSKKLQLYKHLAHTVLNIGIGSKASFHLACELFLLSDWQNPSLELLVKIFNAAVQLEKKDMCLNFSYFKKIQNVVMDLLEENKLLTSYFPCNHEILQILRTLVAQQRDLPQLHKKDKVYLSRRVKCAQRLVLGVKFITMSLEGMNRAHFGKMARVLQIASKVMSVDAKEIDFIKSLVTARSAPTIIFIGGIASLRGYLNMGTPGGGLGGIRSVLNVITLSLCMQYFNTCSNDWDGKVWRNHFGYCIGALAVALLEVFFSRKYINLINLKEEILATLLKEEVLVTLFALAIDSCMQNVIADDLVAYQNARILRPGFWEQNPYDFSPDVQALALQGKIICTGFTSQKGLKWGLKYP